MEIINVEANIMSRKAYVIEADEQHLLDFKEGVEVLPAQYFENDYGNKFYFKQRHEDGEKGWKGGGFECYDTTGAKRAFHLDALIVHPKLFKKKAKVQENKPKGKRGRPKIDPSLKKTPTVYVKTGGKRGRPKMDPALKKSIVYVKTGGKRGRPKKNS